MPRINDDFVIKNTTNIGTLNETYHLLSRHLYLDDEYRHVYTMSYLDNVIGLYPNDYEFDNLAIYKSSTTYNELIDLIKVMFSQQNMLKYFGSNADLMPNVLRKVYGNMAKYFLILFYKKIYEIIGMNELPDNDHECVIAECMNIIRASVKKYARLRISPNTPLNYTKKSLNRRNAIKYGCKNTLEEYEYCPSFSQLQSGYRDGKVDGKGDWHEPKSCRKIIESTLTTNDGYDLLSQIGIPVLFPKKSYSTTFNLKNKNVRRKTKTRKMGQTAPVPSQKKIQIQNAPNNNHITIL